MRTITLARFVGVLIASAAFLLGGTAWADTHVGPFADVPPTHPEAAAITLLRDLGAMSGFEDGTFHPSEPITRAGVVKVSMLARGKLNVALTPESKTSFADVPATHGAAGLIERAAQLGYLTADGTTNFRPDEPATRAEALKLVLTIFEITPGAPSKIPFADMTAEDWATPYAVFASEWDLLRVPTAAFAPNAPMDRGDLARVVATIIQTTRDAQRPAFPPLVGWLLGAGWLLSAAPLVLHRLRARKPLLARASGAILALMLGPIGAASLQLTRIAARVPEAPGITPGRRSLRGRGHLRIGRLVRWVAAVQFELLGLLLALGFLVVVAEALRITLDTAAARTNLAPFLHG